MKRLIDLITRIIDWFNATRPGRTLTRYNESRGELLANGMSFSAIFSVFAGIYVLFAVFGIWLTGQPQLLASIVGQLEYLAPGLIDTGDGGAINIDSFVAPTLGWTGAIALFGLAFTAIGWIGATRGGIRTMARMKDAPVNPILRPLIDAGFALIFGVLLLISAVLTLLGSNTVHALADAFDWGPSFNATFISQVVGYIVVLIVDIATMLFLLRIVGSLKRPLKELLPGAIIGGVALSVLQLLGTALLGGAHTNPLLASFAVIVGLMLWFALICRVILYTSAWISVGAKVESSVGDN